MPQYTQEEIDAELAKYPEGSVLPEHVWKMIENRPDPVPSPNNSHMQDGTRPLAPDEDPPAVNEYDESVHPEDAYDDAEVPEDD